MPYQNFCEVLPLKLRGADDVEIGVHVTLYGAFRTTSINIPAFSFHFGVSTRTEISMCFLVAVQMMASLITWTAKLVELKPVMKVELSLLIVRSSRLPGQSNQYIRRRKASFRTYSVFTTVERADISRLEISPRLKVKAIPLPALVSFNVISKLESKSISVCLENSHHTSEDTKPPSSSTHTGLSTRRSDTKWRKSARRDMST